MSLDLSSIKKFLADPQNQESMRRVGLWGGVGAASLGLADAFSGGEEEADGQKHPGRSMLKSMMLGGVLGGAGGLAYDRFKTISDQNSGPTKAPNGAAYFKDGIPSIYAATRGTMGASKPGEWGPSTTRGLGVGAGVGAWRSWKANSSFSKKDGIADMIKTVNTPEKGGPTPMASLLNTSHLTQHTGESFEDFIARQRDGDIKAHNAKGVLETSIANVNSDGMHPRAINQLREKLQLSGNPALSPGQKSDIRSLLGGEADKTHRLDRVIAGTQNTVQPAMTAMRSQMSKLMPKYISPPIPMGNMAISDPFNVGLKAPGFGPGARAGNAKFAPTNARQLVEGANWNSRLRGSPIAGTLARTGGWAVGLGAANHLADMTLRRTGIDSLMVNPDAAYNIK